MLINGHDLIGALLDRDRLMVCEGITFVILESECGLLEFGRNLQQHGLDT